MLDLIKRTFFSTVGSSQSTDNKDSVSLELNLLRLKLAEKQRHIEAQKQRTREQMEEERKRFGQNVFWFAVGKEKEKKEQNGVRSDDVAPETRDSANCTKCVFILDNPILLL